MIPPRVDDLLANVLGDGERCPVESGSVWCRSRRINEVHSAWWGGKQRKGLPFDGGACAGRAGGRRRGSLTEAGMNRALLGRAL